MPPLPTPFHSAHFIHTSLTLLNLLSLTSASAITNGTSITKLTRGQLVCSIWQSCLWWAEWWYPHGRCRQKRDKGAGVLWMRSKGRVVNNIKALSARCVDLKTSVVGCGNSGFFCHVWIQRCNIWWRQYVGPATICNRYGQCIPKVLCTVEGHKECKWDSGGWVRILRICS